MNSINTDLILEYLNELKELDRDKKLFEARKHKYTLDATLSEKDCKDLEEKFDFSIPKDYRQFLLEVGNKGAGPFYGLNDIRNCVHKYLSSNWTFPFTSNADSDEVWQYLETNHLESIDPQDEMPGFINICEYGCGYHEGLVVRGAATGQIWRTDSGNTFSPVAESFGRWYRDWLEEGLSKFKEVKTDSNYFFQYYRSDEI